MSFADSVANDYRITDSTAPVTFSSKGLDGGADTTIPITDAEGTAIGAREIAGSQGFYELGDRRWSLGNNQIAAGNKPKPGDAIAEADGTTWEILDATLDDFGISWVCSVRKAR